MLGLGRFSGALHAPYSHAAGPPAPGQPQTIAAYRDTWRLLLRFATRRAGKQPGHLDIADLDAPLIGDFLDHLNTTEATAPAPATPGSPPSTRCSATRPCSHPEHAETIARVLAIPPKRFDKALVTWLTEDEARCAARRA